MIKGHLLIGMLVGDGFVEPKRMRARQRPGGAGGAGTAQPANNAERCAQS